MEPAPTSTALEAAPHEGHEAPAAADDRDEIDARATTTPQQEALISRRMQRLIKESRT